MGQVRESREESPQVGFPGGLGQLEQEAQPLLVIEVNRRYFSSYDSQTLIVCIHCTVYCRPLRQQ